MKIRIGDRQLTTKRPADLDAQLLASTGCTPGEVALMLSGSPLAGLVARAVEPFLSEEDRAATPDLASEIEAAGRIGVAAQVATLYAGSGADDLDGMTVPLLREAAERETVDIAGLRKADDIRERIRATRQAKAAQQAEAE
ncbi:MAG: hypothetical protein AB7M12_14355 [Hyphomonadaceae bacterium]